MKKIFFIASIIALSVGANAQQQPKPNLPKPLVIAVRPPDTTKKKHLKYTTLLRMLRLI